MKETHLFYAPNLETELQLPEDEAAHAVRVLRVQEGAELWVTNGKGQFFEATVVAANGGKHPFCALTVNRTTKWVRPWRTSIHIAVAPTKNMDRIEWMAEKATEIGWDGLHFLNCTNSERRILKTDRIHKITVSAMKQSHKALLPQISEQMALKSFLQIPFEGDKFIAHCFDQGDISSTTKKAFLFDVVHPDRSTLVLIGPEGDFSIDEVRAAEAAGFQSVHLGESRLRTETAALMATQLCHLKKTLR